MARIYNSITNLLKINVMKKHLQILSTVLSHLLMTTTTVAQISSGSISGWVHDEKSSLPIPFAKIELLAEGKLIKNSLTDSIGKFQLRIDETQLITLRVSTDKHKSEQRDIISAKGFSAEAYFALKADKDSSKATTPVSSLSCRGPAVADSTMSVVQDGIIGSLRSCRPISTNTYIDGVPVRGASSIQGIITDAESGELLPFSNLALLQNGKLISGATTDINGLYKMADLLPGDYEIQVSYVGYEKQAPKRITLKTGEVCQENISLHTGSIIVCEVVIEAQIEYTCFSCGGCCRVVHTVVGEIAEEPVIVQKEPLLSLYPNPAHSQLTLDLLQLEEEPIGLRILDSSGRIVLEQKTLQMSKLSIPLDGLSNGVYFASVQLKDKLLTERFIVAR